MMGDGAPTLGELVEEYARAYFAEHPNVFEAQPDEFCRTDLEGLSPLARVLFEMVVTDWIERTERSVEPLRMIFRRLREGPPPSVELRVAIEKLCRLSPAELADTVRWLVRTSGDVAFEATLGLYWAAIQEDERRAAEAYLAALGGKRIADDLVARLGVPEGEASAAVMLAVYDVIETAAERRDRWTRSQRGVFRTAVARKAAARLLDAPPHEAAPESVAREAPAADLPAVPLRGDPLSRAKRNRRAARLKRLPSAEATPDARLRAAEDQAALEERLTAAGLTHRERELALALALGGSPSVAEAARELGMAESTARVHVHRIRKKLAKP